MDTDTFDLQEIKWVLFLILAADIIVYLSFVTINDCHSYSHTFAMKTI